MKNKELSSSLEDYLEAIYRISEKKLVAHANQIAKTLDVAKSSVSWALKQLSDKGLINYSPYEAISLTDQGKILAEKIAGRHDEIKNFLCEVLAVEPRLAEENACRLEHVLDKDVLDRMRMFMDFLEKCPRTGKQWVRDFGQYSQKGWNLENFPECPSECSGLLGNSAEQVCGNSQQDQGLPKTSKPRDQYIREHLKDVLAESGRALTDAQQSVIDIFMNCEKHLSMDMILQQARQKNPSVRQGDVDHAMGILCEHKIARSLRFEDRIVYEHYHPESHHDHLYCVKCGAIVEFFDPRIEALQQENAQIADFRLLLHNLNLFGVCQDCIKAESRGRSLDQCLIGETVRIVSLTTDDQTAQRLSNMGLVPGRLIRVLNDRCAGGHVLVMVGESRFMLDPQTARNVRVRYESPGQAFFLPKGRRRRHRHIADRIPQDDNE
ncbi:MAG: transcriptional repressor [Sedimentisphaerales bacterium]|nr:transcriptional repressor [Sedimentisphaerales bacterium]